MNPVSSKSILNALRLKEITLEQAKAQLMSLSSDVSAAIKTPHINEGGNRQASLAAAPSSKDIAIISMAGRFPGARNVETFWENLKAGYDAITEIPGQRWNYELDSSWKEADIKGGQCKWGGFIADVDRFDPLFFRISPREAQLMDPQERILLEVVWELFEGIGYTRKRLASRYGGNISVFAGSMYQQYHQFEADLEKRAAVAMSSQASIANRISHFFDLCGSSMAIDTMCSSGGAAIHLACQSLLSSDCEMAIAAATNLSIHPYKYLALNKAQLLASDVGVGAFGDADGFIPAEAVGAVLLKPLTQAVMENDPIIAVIKSTAIGHKGYTDGFSVPKPRALANLLHRHFERSGIDPQSVSYIEAAASGASLGDVAEIEALNEVFKSRDGRDSNRTIGSVKSNIGHAEAAAGISQVIKVALQLQHQQLVPTIKTNPLNPRIVFDESAFVLQTKLERWETVNDKASGLPAPLRASINTLGAGGAACHLILEEFNSHRHATSQVKTTSNPEIFVFSAKTNERLSALLTNLLVYLKTAPLPSLSRLAYTLQEGREAMTSRLAMIVSDYDALKENLSECIRSLQSTDTRPCGPTIFAYNLEDDLPGRNVEEYSASCLDEWIQMKCLDKIAYAWAHGAAIPWEALHDATITEQPFLSLPTYPFARMQCWLGSSWMNSNVFHSENAVQAAQLVDLMSADDVEQVVLNAIATAVQLDSLAINLHVPIEDYGINSIGKLMLAAGICKAFPFLDETRDGECIIACTSAADIISFVSKLKHIYSAGKCDVISQAFGGAGESIANPERDNLEKCEYKGFVVPEYIEHYHSKGYAFAIKNSDLGALANLSDKRTAVVIGAGPAGLMAALTLKKNGIEQVVLLEKRPAFNRMQMITLYQHTLPYLKKIGVLEKVAARADFIRQHDFYANSNEQRYKYYAKRMDETLLSNVDAEMSYSADRVKYHFVGESVLAISLADLQDVLMNEARAHGVSFFSNVAAEIIKSDTHIDRYGVRIDLSESYGVVEVVPELIVVADGAKSQNAQKAGIHYLPTDSPRGKENWYVFHCKTGRKNSALAYEFAFKEKKQFDNCAFGLFYPQRGEFGVALYCGDDLPPKETFLLEKACFFAKSYDASFDGIQWLTKRITVEFSTADRLAVDNVILVGDAAGTGSPNAGLGSGLAVSAYGWAVQEYCRRTGDDRQTAIDFYNRTAREYVLNWQNRSRFVWSQVLEVPNLVDSTEGLAAR